MKSIRLRDNFYWTGIIDDKLRVFDIIMYTEFGTTYNSYVLKTEHHTVLFETAKVKCLDSWLAKVEEITPIEQVDYLVVSHTEPDHSGSVERLLELNPRIKIVATACAIGFLKEIINRDFYALSVRDGQTLAGSFWDPAGSPYSIPEDGSVVRIFAEHGWSWGGDAWAWDSNPTEGYHDYMHFSYMGG